MSSKMAPQGPALLDRCPQRWLPRPQSLVNYEGRELPGPPPIVDYDGGALPRPPSVLNYDRRAQAASQQTAETNCQPSVQAASQPAELPACQPPGQQTNQPNKRSHAGSRRGAGGGGRGPSAPAALACGVGRARPPGQRARQDSPGPWVEASPKSLRWAATVETRLQERGSRTRAPSPQAEGPMLLAKNETHSKAGVQKAKSIRVS